VSIVVSTFNDTMIEARQIIAICVLQLNAPNFNFYPGKFRRAQATIQGVGTFTGGQDCTGAGPSAPTHTIVRAEYAHSSCWKWQLLAHWRRNRQAIRAPYFVRNEG
jgi:hypothetical protein